MTADHIFKTSWNGSDKQKILTVSLANQQLQAVAAPQRAREDNRGAGPDVHPDVAAPGVRPGGTGKSSPSVNAVPS